jgi:hypothetical protein
VLYNDLKITCYTNLVSLYTCFVHIAFNMANTYVQKTKNLWDSWVSMSLQTNSLHDNDCIELWEWLSLLVRNDILPKLKQSGYFFDCSPDKFIECLLNHYFNVYYKQYYRNRWYTESHNSSLQKPKLHCELCKHAVKKNKHSLISYEGLHANILLEYYDCYKMPFKYWHDLREKYAIEFIADDSDFSNKFWTTLPYIVFGHINHLESPASQEIANRQPCRLEEDYGNEENIKAFISATMQQTIESDPYYKEYYKQ